MRFIKLGLISFIFFFLLLTAISLFIPSHIRISKAVNVGASPANVLNYISDTSRWKEWHPLAQQPGKYIQARKINQTDSSVTFETQYGTQASTRNGWQAYHFPSQDSITVQWYMDFQLKWYPWQKFGSLFYENTYGAIMQQGLENLRQKPLQ